MADVVTSDGLKVSKLSRHIGAVVEGIDLSQPIDAAMSARLKQLWLDHVILLFRGQPLSQADLRRVTEMFGPIGKLARPAKFRPPGFDNLLEDIMLISNIRENGEAIGALPDGEMMFHHDMIHAELPHNGTCLFAVEVPSVGGNTLFASCYAAYETLDPAVRARLEGRRARHFYSYGAVQRGDPNRQAVAASAQSAHPVFRTHDETGRKAVYVNRLMTEEIEGLEPDESARLLELLFDHSENPEFVYEHVWRPGDLIVWDNRASMHARTDFSPGERRLLLRTTIAGGVRPN